MPAVLAPPRSPIPEPIVDDATRRELLAGIVAFLVLAGCGDDDEPDRARTAASEDRTRSVTHALGTTQVPATPERVIALVPALLDAALAVGVVPIAASPLGEGGAFPERLGDVVSRIEPLRGEPNLELIASLRPDLILTQEFNGQAYGGFQELSAVAATVPVSFPVPAARWHDYVAAVAAALGRESELAEVRSAYEERAAEVAAAISPRVEGKRVSTLRIDDPGMVRGYGADSFSGSVLTAAGIAHVSAPAGAKVNPQGYFDVSAERLPEVAGEVTFFYSGHPDVLDQVIANPLWANLDSVRAGLAFKVDEEHWPHIGYSAANAILGDLEGLLG